MDVIVPESATYDMDVWLITKNDVQWFAGQKEYESFFELAPHIILKSKKDHYWASLKDLECLGKPFQVFSTWLWN